MAILTPPTEPAIDRRQTDLAGISSAKLYLFSALGLTVLMVLAFLTIVLTHMLTQRPDQALDLKPLNTVAYFLAGIIIALFAGAGINVVNVLNGHTASMMRLVAEKERARGQLEGLQMPVPGAEALEKIQKIEAHLKVAEAEGRAAGVEQERVRTEEKPR